MGHPSFAWSFLSSTCRRQVEVLGMTKGELKILAYLGEDLGYYVARNVGQTEVAALELEGQLGVIHT